MLSLLKFLSICMCLISIPCTSFAALIKPSTAVYLQTETPIEKIASSREEKAIKALKRQIRKKQQAKERSAKLRKRHEKKLREQIANKRQKQERALARQIKDAKRQKKDDLRRHKTNNARRLSAKRKLRKQVNRELKQRTAQEQQRIAERAERRARQKRKLRNQIEQEQTTARRKQETDYARRLSAERKRERDIKNLRNQVNREFNKRPAQEQKRIAERAERRARQKRKLRNQIEQEQITARRKQETDYARRLSAERKRNIQILRNQVDTELNRRPKSEQKRILERANRVANEKRWKLGRSQTGHLNRQKQIDNLRKQVDRELAKRSPTERSIIVERANQNARTSNTVKPTKRQLQIERLRRQVNNGLRKMPRNEAVVIAERSVERAAERQRLGRIKVLKSKLNRQPEKTLPTTRVIVNNNNTRNTKIKAIHRDYIKNGSPTSFQAMTDAEKGDRISALLKSFNQSQIQLQKENTRVQIIETVGSLVPGAGHVIDYQNQKRICANGTTAQCVLSRSESVIGIVPVGRVAKLRYLSKFSIRFLRINKLSKKLKFTGSVNKGGNLLRTTQYKGKNFLVSSGHGYLRTHKGGDIKNTGFTMDQIDTWLVDDLHQNIKNGNDLGYNMTKKYFTKIDDMEVVYTVTKINNNSYRISNYFPKSN